MCNENAECYIQVLAIKFCVNNDEAYDIVSRGYCMARRCLFCSI